MRSFFPVSGDVGPPRASDSIDITREFLGTVSVVMVKDNFDIVYQPFEETLDAGGHHLTT
ncbi:hypothetical protein GYMLUDRAFT_581021 [Collybiopsis luxurians FD-317 M1]|uniref:Uncharacterized protein n=1 Tax=Collybiopsis luxurians FD-317 M1 TaxID=944289 RepID=A0A0D0BZL5_9AGAR|nr:hypothetical protein GYMLUDRAFT_581021 [Collybiopsis luxurians FD-317 M1]